MARSTVCRGARAAAGGADRRGTGAGAAAPPVPDPRVWHPRRGDRALRRALHRPAGDVLHRGQHPPRRDADLAADDPGDRDDLPLHRRRDRPLDRGDVRAAGVDDLEDALRLAMVALAGDAGDDRGRGEHRLRQRFPDDPLPDPVVHRHPRHARHPARDRAGLDPHARRSGGRRSSIRSPPAACSGRSRCRSSGCSASC